MRIQFYTENKFESLEKTTILINRDKCGLMLAYKIVKSLSYKNNSRVCPQAMLEIISNKNR